jgi:hypothetical protein
VSDGVSFSVAEVKAAEGAAWEARDEFDDEIDVEEMGAAVIAAV